MLDVLTIQKDGSITYLNLDFEKSPIDKIMTFCDETGVVTLLGNIKDLHAYLTGVEVGMDTNARKNRSGTAFEKMMLDGLSAKGVEVKKPDKKFDLGRSKTPDLAIYKDGEVFAVVEVNFFNETGSKPLETVQSYITLQRAAHEKGIRFILVTDGPSWKCGREERERAFEQLDYPFNYNMAVKLIPKMLKG
jgi:type II restriction enzyme